MSINTPFEECPHVSEQLYAQALIVARDINFMLKAFGLILEVGVARNCDSHKLVFNTYPRHTYNMIAGDNCPFVDELLLQVRKHDDGLPHVFF